VNTNDPTCADTRYQRKLQADRDERVTINVPGNTIISGLSH
jgi:hypothetical protein